MELTLTNLWKSFDERVILRDISFTIRSGKPMGYLGRNGAGKTTTFRMLTDIFRPDQGRILLDGEPLQRDRIRIGYLPEERGLYAKVAVCTQLQYLAELRGIPRQEAAQDIIQWLKRFELEDRKDDPLETLSKGNQQKVQIIQAFLGHPDLLILDEPFSGLDPVNARLLSEAIRDFAHQDKLLIFSSHQMSLVETFCDDITLIDHGSIRLSGSLNGIRRSLGAGRFMLRGIDQNGVIRLEAMGFACEMSAQGTLVTPTDQHDKRALLRALADQDIAFQLLEDYLPDLDTIFISTVGDQHA